MIEHIFMYLLAICIFSLKKCLSSPLSIFKLTIWFLCCWVVWVSSVSVNGGDEHDAFSKSDRVGERVRCDYADNSVGKESAYNAGDPSSIPGSGRSAREGIGYPLQYSWASLVAQLVKNLPAMRVWCKPGFDAWVGKIPWRRERLPTAVFWPGDFHGLYSPWGPKESDTPERLSLDSTDGKEMEAAL